MKDNKKISINSWHSISFGKRALILLIILFLAASWYRLLLAILLLPLILAVYKRSKVGIVLAGLYSIFLSFVSVSVHVAQNQNAQGDFDPNGFVVFGYLFLTIAIIKYLQLYFKDLSATVGKLRVKEDRDNNIPE